jgi:hypothetical protein
MLAGIVIAIPGCLLLSGAAQAYDGNCSTQQNIVDLPPGHWCQVPNSHLRDVEKKPHEWPDWNGNSSASYDSYQRNAGVAGVIAKWSGGTFDTRRDRLLIFGGGHNGYGGNEIYAFSLQTLSWERLSDPTAFPNRGGSTNPDGTPISRHTYGGLAYVEQLDQLFALGGAPDSESGGCGTPGTWFFDLQARENDGVYSLSHWVRRSSNGEPVTRCEDDAIYVPQHSRVLYQHGTNPNGVAAYNVLSNSWSQVSSDGKIIGTTPVLIENRGIIVQFGDNRVNGYVRWGNLGGNLSRSVVGTTGPDNMERAFNPGAAYDSASDLVIAWSGGTTVYGLDVDQNQWQSFAPASGNAVDPGPVNAEGGTFGRFAYSETLNVFVTVDHVDENVFLYRLAPGSGSPIDPAPEPPTLNPIVE